ncbi:MAG: endo-1,4-beta-xylanase [Bacteroidales bacterium]|nr:endo-1,4-beta-xylanase [Bacteroidales bacterium]
MKTKYYLPLLLLLSFCSQPQEMSSLKETYDESFTIGVALGDDIITSQDSQIHTMINREFNSVVAENCMKSEVIQPSEGEFDFTQSDRFVDFGMQNNMEIIGHTLIWHSQAPPWFFTDSSGADVSREIMIGRMENHINNLVGRYKGKVYGWDIVNEAVDDSGELRKSKFHQIIGEDYIELAFKFAHNADPLAKLFYNDYNLWKPERRDGTIELMKGLQEKGIPVHGLGMQAHWGLDTPFDLVEKSIVEFSKLGIDIMLTELDITAIPFPSEELTADISTNYEYLEKYNPYPESLPDSVQTQLSKKYSDLFDILLRYQDVISRVTFWGLNDSTTWRNNWPVKGRVDYPLLFDKNNQPKPAYFSVIEAAKNNLGNN